MNYKYVKIGFEWMKKRYPELFKGKSLHSELYHHGVKGMKWGVRRTPEQLGHRKRKQSISKMYGHSGPSKQGAPNSIADHIDENGKVKTRAFYNSDGWKEYEIHTTNHGNPKNHPYGVHGEHIHHYTWDYKTGRQVGNERDEISDEVRKENGDIL